MPCYKTSDVTGNRIKIDKCVCVLLYVFVCECVYVCGIVGVYVWECTCGSVRVGVYVWECTCGSVRVGVYVWECMSGCVGVWVSASIKGFVIKQGQIIDT